MKQMDTSPSTIKTGLNEAEITFFLLSVQLKNTDRKAGSVRPLSLYRSIEQ